VAVRDATFGLSNADTSISIAKCGNAVGTLTAAAGNGIARLGAGEAPS